MFILPPPKTIKEKRTPMSREFDIAECTKVSYISYNRGRQLHYRLHIPIMLLPYLRKRRGSKEFEATVYNEVTNDFISCKVVTVPHERGKDASQLLILPFAWNDRPARAFFHYRDKVVSEGLFCLVDEPNHRFWEAAK